MIAYTTALLFIIGIFSSFKVPARFDRLTSFLVFVGVVATFWGLEQAALKGRESVLSFMWNSSPSGDIKIDIVSNAYNYGLIFPFFVITLIFLMNNTLFRYEERRNNHSAFLLFNLATLIMMITSNNFVQLLSALFVVDILAFFIVKDVEACRRYVLLNIVADMMIFMVLTLINCRVNSLDIGEILLYKKEGNYLDFIALVGLIAVFIKLGYCGFQAGLYGLRRIRLHRLQEVLFLSSPATAVIILMKFHVLWRSSIYYTPLLCTMSVLTIINGFLGSLIYNDYKTKIIYFQMMFWALFVILLHFYGFIWTENFTRLLLAMFILHLFLYGIYFYMNRRPLVSQMMLQPISNKSAGYSIFGAVILETIIISGALTMLYNNTNRYYIWLFGCLFILSLSSLWRQIYFFFRKKMKYANKKSPYKMTFFMMLCIISYILSLGLSYFEFTTWAFALIFIVLCFTNPYTYKLYKRQKLQCNDWSGKMYRSLILRPLNFVGRCLWIIFDRVIIEKAIIGLTSSCGQYALRFFRKLHSSRTGGIAFVIILLIALLYLSFVQGESHV